MVWHIYWTRFCPFSNGQTWFLPTFCDQFALLQRETGKFLWLFHEQFFTVWNIYACQAYKCTLKKPKIGSSRLLRRRVLESKNRQSEQQRNLKWNSFLTQWKNVLKPVKKYLFELLEICSVYFKSEDLGTWLWNLGCTHCILSELPPWCTVKKILKDINFTFPHFFLLYIFYKYCVIVKKYW